jgi:hypothetical protein
MGPTREAIPPNLAERLCWQAARREDTRVARRLYRTHVVEGGYRLDEGALRDDFCHCLRAWGVLDLMAGVQGPALPRQRVPVGPDLVRYGWKPWCGMERMHALPALLVSDEALLPWVGFHAQQGRHGICPRGAAKRQRPRTAGPLCPDTLANHRVQLTLRDLEAWFNGTLRALAKAGLCGAKVPGIVEATALETTPTADGGGQGTRPRQITDTPGQGRESEGPVSGGKVRVLIEALTTMPLAVKVGPIHAPDVRSRRALVTQARTPLAGDARRHTVVVAQGLLAGVELWWLDQPGLTGVGPAKDPRAVTAEARAPAAAGGGVTVGRRGHTVRHGPGNTAWTARRETAVVGLTGLTPDDQDGTPEHGRHTTAATSRRTPCLRWWCAGGLGGTTARLATPCF